MFLEITTKKTSSYFQRGLKVILNDFVFLAALTLAVISCFVAVPKFKYIDFKVIISLFNLMLVIKAFEELKLLDKAAVFLISRCKSVRAISLALTFLCFFASMLITNDVALITFVPLAIIIGKKADISMMETIILQTLAANIGSSVTPMGNPQNLFIFSYFNLSLFQFFKTMSVVGILGFLWLYILNFRIKNKPMNVRLEKVEVVKRKEAAVWTIVFLIVLASVFRLIDYRVAMAVCVLIALFINKRLLFKVDYLLLITFLCFFIFIGNISSINSVNEYFIKHLSSSKATYLTSIGASQFISNVPCSILLSHFTKQWKPLLLGVNIGGVGTLIASLASVISYKLFIRDNEQNAKGYISKFNIYNFITLAVIAVICIITI